MARARLVDVATAAGVSTATVSLVLREQPGPSDATRQVVRDAAARLNYRPDRTASLLARRRSGMVGVVLDVTSAFHGELAVALDDAAATAGFDLVLSTVTDRRDERDAIDTLLDFRCEALILLGGGLRDRELAALAVRTPAIVVGRVGSGSARGVRTDDAIGLGLAVDHLVALGHTTIAFADGPRGTIASARRAGYRRAMKRHGLAANAQLIPGGQTEAAGEVAGAAILDAPAGRRPTAVVCFNDRCAIGLRDKVIRGGLRVPEDLSIVGYDDSPPARLATVDLSSISQDPPALAASTLRTVAEVLTSPTDTRGTAAGEPPAYADIVLPPKLIARTSSGPAPRR